MLDLLLKRYSNIDYVMKMDAEDGLKLIIKAIENEAKDKQDVEKLKMQREKLEKEKEGNMRLICS